MPLAAPKPAPAVLSLFVDGGSRGNPGPAGGGFAVFRGKTQVLRGSLFFGEKTNNQAEYMALRVALMALLERFPAEPVHCYMDSQLVVEQVSGRYKVKSPNVKPLYEDVKQLIASLTQFHISHIPREKNRVADKLANEAMDRGK